MKISLIAAVAENGVIGNKGHLPWHIKSEFQYFKDMTVRKPVIMGRKTFDGLPGGPLKDRPNIVITRDPSYTHLSATVTTSLERALEIARKYGGDEIMIAGGAEIYKLAMPMADRLYLTEIHLKPEGDTKFPAFDRKGWVETKREFHKAQPGESADYTITVLDRKAS
jgi:dihydrofolate reductase